MRELTGVEVDLSSGRESGRALAFAVWTIGLVVVALALSRRWLPPLASDHGTGVDRTLHFTMLSTGIMILLGHAFLGYLLWRFGRQDHVSFRLASRQTERRWSVTAALIMAVIAEGGVLALGLPVWNQYFGSTAPSNALVIEVTTEQFAWNVRYAGPNGIFGRTEPKRITLDTPLGIDAADPHGKDDIVGLNVIHAVVNRPVKIRLRSKDVLHSFFLPNLRVKQDSVPGMTIDFWFTPTRSGRFELACAQLCGFGHYEMKGVLIVESPEEWSRWAEEQLHG
jgi:cytochrome c oxidase subunit 2